MRNLLTVHRRLGFLCHELVARSTSLSSRILRYLRRPVSHVLHGNHKPCGPRLILLALIGAPLKFSSYCVSCQSANANKFRLLTVFSYWRTEYS